MQSTPSNSGDSDDDDDEMFTPVRTRTRRYSRGQIPLTPPDSSRRSDVSDAFSRPSAGLYYPTSAPIPRSRIDAAHNVHGQYLSSTGKVTDVFAAVAHGNDYSFFPTANSHAMLSPAHSRGDSLHSHEYFPTSAYTPNPQLSDPFTPNSQLSEHYGQSPQILEQQQYNGQYLMPNDGYNVGQASYPAPPAWYDASRRLQFVTSSELDSMPNSMHATPDLSGNPVISSVDLSTQCESGLGIGLYDTPTTDVFGNHFGYHTTF